MVAYYVSFPFRLLIHCCLLYFLHIMVSLILPVSSYLQWFHHIDSDISVNVSQSVFKAAMWLNSKCVHYQATCLLTYLMNSTSHIFTKPIYWKSINSALRPRPFFVEIRSETDYATSGGSMLGPRGTKNLAPPFFLATGWINWFYSNFA